MRFWLSGLVMIVLIGCSESSDTLSPTKTEPAPTVVAIESPLPTPTPEPLTESEELDESDYYDTSITLTDVPGILGGAVLTKPVFLYTITKRLFEIAVPRSGPFTISGKDSGDEK